MTAADRDRILSQPTTLANVLRLLLELEVFDPADIDDRESIDLLLTMHRPTNQQLRMPLGDAA